MVKFFLGGFYCLFIGFGWNKYYNEYGDDGYLEEEVFVGVL